MGTVGEVDWWVVGEKVGEEVITVNIISCLDNMWWGGGGAASERESNWRRRSL